MRLIDADALFITINKIKCPQGACMQDGLADACQAVMDAPTIEAEPVRHGRWKKSKKEKMYCDWEMNSWFDYSEVCTVCGYDATEYGCGVGNYCPNCGAKMEVEE